MTDKFRTEAEIEKYLERFHVTLRDSKGRRQLIEADTLTWQWFLILTYSGSLTPETIVDGVIQWKKDDYPNQEINFLFSEYIAFMTNGLAPETIKFMEEEYQNSDPESHPFFNKIYGSREKDR